MTEMNIMLSTTVCGWPSMASSVEGKEVDIDFFFYFFLPFAQFPDILSPCTRILKSF